MYVILRAIPSCAEPYSPRCPHSIDNSSGKLDNEEGVVVINPGQDSRSILPAFGLREDIVIGVDC